MNLRYCLILALTLACLFWLQDRALHASGGRTMKSESNFFSSLGRIQAAAQGKPKVMVVGSSITGRLPDRAQGFAGVANMGCDGGSAVDALRAMDRGILPTAPWIVIEANTLHLALESKPTEISKAMHGAWFRAGMSHPCLSAYARPAAFFYSKLLAKRTGAGGPEDFTADLGVRSLPQPLANRPETTLTREQEKLVAEVGAILKRLQAGGCRSMVVWLPPARGDGSPAPDWILEMARRGGSLWWDLGQEAIPGTVTLTDGVHMAAPSAARTMVSLISSLKNRD